MAFNNMGLLMAFAAAKKIPKEKRTRAMILGAMTESPVGAIMAGKHAVAEDEVKQEKEFNRELEDENQHLLAIAELSSGFVKFAHENLEKTTLKKLSASDSFNQLSRIFRPTPVPTSNSVVQFLAPQSGSQASASGNGAARTRKTTRRR